MQLDNLCGLFVGILVVGGFTALFVWVVIQGRKQDAALRDLMTGIGYAAIPNNDSGIMERMETLYRALLHPQQGLSATNVYTKRDSGADLHVLDIGASGTRRRETAGKMLGRRAVMLTAPDLHVPRMYLYPKMPDNGTAAAVIGMRVSQTLAYATLFEVDLADHPEFQRRFRVMSDDPHAVKDFLTNSRLSGLLGLDPSYGIDAMGDALIVNNYYPQPGSEDQQIARSVQTAQDAHRILRSEE